MQDYLNIFIDKEYPNFIDKYLNTETLNRIKHVTQFCGCDYTKLYNPRFLFTRFDHSLVVAHIVWHFTHDKKSTIVALLHDVGTPCFAHTIDCVMGDYINQESSEISIIDIIKKDSKLLKLLKEDNIALDDFNDMSIYPILENRSPKLCADRLDGVLHTCYIWIHTHELNEIKEVYDNLCLLTNESNNIEIGFKNKRIANKFVKMVYVYAKELQGNRDKYVMKYISEVIKLAFNKNLITLNDLYTKKEIEIVDTLRNNFDSWKIFEKSIKVNGTEIKPRKYHISFDIKRRNVIPLVLTKNGIFRIIDISLTANNIYTKYNNYKDKKYGYIKDINKV